MMPDASAKDLLTSSSLVFSGTVLDVGTSSVPGLPVNNRTAIVRVDEMLTGPSDLLRLPSGSQVTVQLAADLPELQPGDQAAFFTNGLAYGESIAVAEVGRIPVEQTPAGPRLAGGLQASRAVEEATAAIAQDEVLGHARRADAVLRGQVVSLAATPDAGAPREHDPNWWIARLAVDLVVKASVPGLEGGTGSVDVLYANSIDIRWKESPKPKAAQAGLWLLHDTAPENEHLAPLQMLHSIDLQPSIQLEFLRERGL
jgi:hypothetical protein